MGQEFQAQQFRAVPFVSAIYETSKEERTTSKTRFTTKTSIVTEHLQQKNREKSTFKSQRKKLNDIPLCRLLYHGHCYKTTKVKQNIRKYISLNAKVHLMSLNAAKDRPMQYFKSRCNRSRDNCFFHIVM